jgi:cell division protein FtsI/penicillin-binding protein 2
MFQKDFSKKYSFLEKIERYLIKLPFFRGLKISKEFQLMGIFCLLFFIIITKLFYVQIVKHNYYETLLNKQHTRSTSIKAKR